MTQKNIILDIRFGANKGDICEEYNKSDPKDAHDLVIRFINSDISLH
ncbi:MAG: hypothetical protein L0H53_08705 [Candidatus Nitrosocosmicus sp.]|nr:hypothetical protein [Candidatus Nitrosocosmicus sp.]MDN5868854.1 hypothetical protein [Candidatus Nitrosocosmicus sp.]